MKRLFLMLAMVFAMVFAFSSISFAHLNNYNAADRQGKITVKYNSTMIPFYKQYLDRAFLSWNNARLETGNTNFPQFVAVAPGSRPTLDVGLYREDDNVLGYYRYYSGPKTDLIRMNTRTLGTTASKVQRTSTHEAGHAAMFTHNFLPCTQSVMPQTSTCGSSRSLFPASHDKADVKNAPKMWNKNSLNAEPGAEQIEEPEEIEDLPVGMKVVENLVEGDKKTLVSETYRFNDGYLIVEYDRP